MEGRCDLVLLGWTAFVGFNLISDFVLHETGSVVPETLGLYRGRYRLWSLSNESVGGAVTEGPVRLSMASRLSGAPGVRVASLSMDLVDDGYYGQSSTKSDLLFNGIEVSGASTFTAKGASDPARFNHAGPRPCLFEAVIFLGEPSEAVAKASGGSKAGQDSDEAADEAPRFRTLEGQVRAADCQFAMTFTVNAIDMKRAKQKTVNYSIWANIITLLQIRQHLMQLLHTEEGPSAAKVSILCIGMQVCMDAYDSFLHFCVGITSQYMFNALATVSVFKFILFSAVETRYFLTIARQRLQNSMGQGWDVGRRELSFMYSRFYGVLVLGCILIYHNLRHLQYIVLICQLYWVPQIVLDAWQGSRSALKPAYVGGMSVTRLLPVLYLWGCPEGIFDGDFLPRAAGAPSATVCLAAVSIQAAQVATLALQRYIGPRWFIPRIFMPQAYNYYRRGQVDPGAECVICMCEIDIEDARRVTTPCDHVFHRACLSQWMDVKSECPTCRAHLPPI